MKTRSSILTSADVLQIIEDARDAELCRNLDLFREILSTFWADIGSEPDVLSFEAGAQPELLRLCGVFLSQFGRAQGLPDYQLRAKDILTRSAEIFEEQNCRDKTAETKVALANCFWFSGEVAEYDDLLRSVEDEFGVAPDHPVSIQIKLNRLLIANWRQDLEEAKYRIAEISGVISPDHDFRLRTQFHNLAGIACRIAGDLERSAIHAIEAVRISRDARNEMFVAFNLNNLAFVYRVDGQLDRAHQTIDEAISVMESRQDKGWIPHALDTKALIYLDQGEYADALKVIDRSIAIFSEGEDYSGLTDAMWTKCQCLLRLDRTGEAVVLFADLKAIAARQIGEVAVDKFAALFAAEVYALKHFPLSDEVAAFKRARVVRAMRESEGHVGDAARALGLRSQQHLSDILNNQFPDIYDELRIKRRARRSGSAAPKSPVPAPVPAGVTRLIMPKNRTYSFNFAYTDQSDPHFYYFPRHMMGGFGVKTDAVVAVVPARAESLYHDAPVLYVLDDIFRIGRLSFDDFTGLFLVDLEDFIFLSDVQLLGVPVGYCPASARNEDMMRFEALRQVKEGINRD
jgi:tetratricopeptide (TPR) repeat protein